MSNPKYNYWQETYGQKSNEFIEGVIVGVQTYAVWKDGQQLVGTTQRPLKDVLQEIKVGMGYKAEGK
jgi:hypothetical protein